MREQVDDVNLSVGHRSLLFSPCLSLSLPLSLSISLSLSLSLSLLRAIDTIELMAEIPSAKGQRLGPET